jgi:peptidyl-prolyl cis-trans isomerase C
MSCPSSTPAAKPTHELFPIYVNGEMIAESVIAQEVQHHPADSVEEAVRQASHALVIQCLLKQKAREQGLLDEGSDTAQEEQAISRLLEQDVPVPSASDKECQRYYEANLERFCSSPLVEVRHILLPVAPDDLKGRMELKEKAEMLAQQLQEKPALFADFVAQYSACPSKETGGSLGQLSRGQTVEEFEKTVFNLPEGIAARPVETRYGFHIVQVHRRIDGKQLDFDVVADQVRQYLNEQTQRKAISQYLNIIMSEADIDGFTPQVSGSPLIQ